MQFIVTGDFHGKLPAWAQGPIETNTQAIICLGDVGCNFYGEGSVQDTNMKHLMQNSGNIFYLVRGNHEFRPTKLSTITTKIDEHLNTIVYIEPKYPNIRYLRDIDTGYINLDGKKIHFGVIGGAYSVDKDYRLAWHPWTWFEDEQLSPEEMEHGRRWFENKKDEGYDIIFSHTCPFSCQPFDKFLPSIDQNEVDKSMEEYLEEINQKFKPTYWFAGHYHIDRWQNEQMRFVYQDAIDLNMFFRGKE